jgi:RecA-family ATPase
LAAEAGGKKTILIERLAADLSIGYSILGGYANTGSRRSLILAGEAGADLLVRRAQQSGWLMEAEKILVVDHNELTNHEIPISLDDGDGFNNFSALVESKRPDIVFVDSLMDFMNAADENKGSEMRPVLAQLTRLATNKNIALVLCHHVKKRTSVEKAKYRLDMDSVIGASMFNRFAASMMMLEKRQIISDGKPEEATKTTGPT